MIVASSTAYTDQYLQPLSASLILLQKPQTRVPSYISMYVELDFWPRTLLTYIQDYNLVGIDHDLILTAKGK